MPIYAAEQLSKGHIAPADRVIGTNSFDDVNGAMTHVVWVWLQWSKEGEVTD